MTPIHLTDFTSADNLTSYGPTPSFAVPAHQLCLVAISNYAQFANVAAPNAVTVTATAGALTLHKLSERAATAQHEPSIALWGGVPTADFTGTVTVGFATTQRGIAISVERIDAARAEPVRLGNRPTPTAGTGTGVTSTLAALAAATSLHYYAVAHQANEATTVAGGFTELSDLPFADAGNSTAHALSTGWKANDTTADPSWATSSAYAIASLEIQAAVVTAAPTQAAYQPVWLLDLVAT